MKKNIIKNYKCLFLFLLLLSSCSLKHVVSDVGELRNTYSGHLFRDSIFLYDSIFIKEKSDTVFINRNRIMYRDKFITDTIWHCDTVYNVKEVFVESRNEKIISLKTLFFIVVLILLLWKSGLFTLLKSICRG